MGSSNHIVIRPDELFVLSRQLDSDADRVRAVARRVDATTAAVRLNGNDPGISVAAFGSARRHVESRLRMAADAMKVDADLMARTVDEALAGDITGSADRIDELSERIRAWDGSDNDPRLDRLVGERNELIAELAETMVGDRSAVVAASFRRWIETGGSLGALMVVSGRGERAVRIETGRLVATGEWEAARRFDAASAVARLLLSAGAGGGDVVTESLAVFEARVADGVDVSIAATTARMELARLSGSELTELTDRLVAAFEPGATGRAAAQPEAVTAQEWAWLPFTMRVALEQQRQRRSRAGSGDRIQSSAWVPDFTGGPDQATTRVAVVAELGRAGIDTGEGATLADQLVDLALAGTGPGAEDLRVQARIADALADPTTGLGRPFFAALGSAGTATLPGVVAATTQHGTRRVLPPDEAKLDVIGRYGTALAAVDRAGALTFTVEDLFTRPAAHSPASYFAGTGSFRQDFVIGAATAVLADLDTNPWELADPRTLVLAEINGHGGAGRIALLDALERHLGPDYLDSLLWPPVAFPAAVADDRHVLDELFAPLLIQADRRPGLATEIVEAATRHDEVPALATADVIQHAILSDTLLIAPEHGAAFGRPAGMLSVDRSPQLIVDVMERVFLAGSGGGLLLYMDGVVPAVTEMAYVAGGLEVITDEYLELGGELVGTIRAAFTNARLTDAVDADRLIENAKFYGTSVATALGGLVLLEAGAVLSVGGGFAMNVIAGHAADFLHADNVERVLATVVVEEDGQSSRNRLQVADTLVEVGGLSEVTRAMQNGFTDTVIVRINGRDAGTVGAWQDRITSIEARSHDYTRRYVRMPAETSMSTPSSTQSASR